MKRAKLSAAIGIASLALSAAVFANPYPYHHGGSYSDDDTITTTTTSSYSDDDVTSINKSYSDDDTTTVNTSLSDDDTITTSYSDDDVTKIRNDYKSSWESNYTSNWRNTDERFTSSVESNDKVKQDAGHQADANVTGTATGHSNATRGATMFMDFGGLGNPVSNSGVYIDNTDNNSNQFGIGSSQSSVQAGGDLGDRIISLQGVGNTDGSAYGNVGTYGSNDIGQFGDSSASNQKSVSGAASK